jgi:Ca2+/Na+ antiporter
MASNELVIKINGDVENFTDALDEASAKTESLSDTLATTAKVSAVAFAALTAEIGLAVAAYAESEQATNTLTNALINQGIYSKELVEQYSDMATELQNLTGISDETIMNAQATMQAFLGQTQVTKELTSTLADFASFYKMDLVSAAQLFGKAIDGNTSVLSRYGVSIDENATKSERLAAILEQVSMKAGGSAVAAAEGLSGSLSKLKENFSSLQEAIGARFAPILQSIVDKISSFFQAVSQNQKLADMAAAVLAGGAAFTGLLAAVSAAGVAFLSLKALLVAAGVAFSTLAAPVALAVAGIAAISAAVAYLVLNWTTVWPKMQAAFSVFADNIKTLAMGLGKIILGFLIPNPAMIKAGIEDTKAALTAGLKDYEKISTEKLALQEAKENEAEQKKKERNDRMLEAQKEFHAKEAEEEETDKEYRKRIREEAIEEQREERMLAYEGMLAQNEEFQAMDQDQQAQFRAINDEQNIARAENERTAQQLAAQNRLAEQAQTNQKFLLEQQKYGTAYATINKIMHSEVYQGTKQATNEMVQYQQSSNATLKGIGKAAAVASIIIKTAESAMNIYAGFSTIPIVGPVLGVAGAAAAVMFGAEQVGKVTGAAQGALLTGGIPGVDSIPVMAQRGELISPAQTFEEVIGSVRAKREADKLSGEGGFIAGGGQSVRVVIGLDGQEASRVLTARQIEDERLGLSARSDT